MKLNGILFEDFFKNVHIKADELLVAVGGQAFDPLIVAEFVKVIIFSFYCRYSYFYCLGFLKYSSQSHLFCYYSDKILPIILISLILREMALAHRKADVSRICDIEIIWSHSCLAHY